MKEKKVAGIIVCCYCGIRPATTKDHIPPKAIFNKPRPDDLITVPSCFECNNEASKYDEKFKVYLGMHVARTGGEAEKLFKVGVLPTAKHNDKLRHTILQSMYPVYTTTGSGIITGKGMALAWDNEVHQFMIDRIIRGLFFYHYGKIIGSEVIVKTQWLDEPLVGFEDKLYVNSIANDNFIYQYNKIDGAYDSMWLFNFYKSHFASGMVLSTEAAIEMDEVSKVD